MSHEVRNPLVAIKTFAQLLPERYQDTEFQHEFKDLVSSEVERLNSIVDQIHDFAHPPALTFKAIQTKACIASACARVFPAEPPSSIRVTVSAPDTLPTIQGDDRALIEAFTHILTNSKEALAATQNPEITLTLRLAEDPGPIPAITVIFKDNGPGIAPAMLDKLFSPFSTTKARGLGLGLPIVRRTILDHNGTLTVHSNELGVLITIRLPLLHPKTGSPS
jgi:signal transduction histidine kinase